MTTRSLTLSLLIGLLATAPRLAADTHRFTPERFYNTYSFAHPPALRIKPGDRVITTTLDAGNLDYAGVTAGVKVLLPVNEPGALLFIGDGHARQGEGEVVGTGLETSMDVEFTVDLVKKKAASWPRMDTDSHVMALGSARPLLQALQHATSEMPRWLMADYGFSERGASAFMGQALEYEIANVVDPNFTVVAKVRKALLPPR